MSVFEDGQRSKRRRADTVTRDGPVPNLDDVGVSLHSNFNRVLHLPLCPYMTPCSSPHTDLYTDLYTCTFS